MATSQQFLLGDSSTLANFKAWAQAISGFFTTAGWTQSADTGQVNWSSIASVPTANNWVYEVWQPNDGLTTFYVKIEYGNNGTAAQPNVRITISTSTNGAGVPTGLIIGPTTTVNNGTTPDSVTPRECNFSGGAGRIGAMLWRNAGGNLQQLFAIERSLNSSGSYTSNYVTLWTCGNCATFNHSQQSLVLSVGAGPNLPHNFSGVGGWPVRLAKSANSAGSANPFNGALAFDTCAPSVPYWDYPCTMVGGGNPGDFAEGVTFTVSLYGATRTYMPSKAGPFAYDPANSGNSNGCLAMRYD